MNMKRPDAVLFDMDGLLLDTEATLKLIWQREAAWLGFDLSDDLYAHLVGVPNVLCEEKLMQWFRNFPLDEFRRRWKAAREEERRTVGIPPKAGAFELVTWIEGQGVPMALSTSSTREAVERNRAFCPELFRFASIMTVEEVERPKPDPDIYLRTCAALGVSPGACVIFEDSNPGMRAAIASGARAIMIPDLVTPEPEVRAGAARIFPSLVHALDSRQEWFCGAEI
jgi:beta-phosphoglucomutase-like phosphatase (HAD superfamily)